MCDSTCIPFAVLIVSGMSWYGRFKMVELRKTLSNIWHRMLNPRIVDSRLALAIEGANDGLWDWDLRTNTIIYSPRWSTALGYTTEDLGNHVDEWLQRIHADDLPTLQRATDDHFSGKTPFFQAEFRMKDR